MPGPLQELADRSDARLHQLIALIEHAGREEESLGSAYLGRRGADVLAHLHGWHLLFEGWLAAEAVGEPVILPAAGYTWEGLRALNDALYERYRGLGYGEIKDMVLASHAHMFDLLWSLPEEGLTNPSAHPWSSEPLLVLADECAGRHYDWGIERIEEALA